VFGCTRNFDIWLENCSQTCRITPFAVPPSVDEHEEQLDLRTAVVVTMALIGIVS